MRVLPNGRVPRVPSWTRAARGRRDAGARRGFTLIEVLIALAIVAIALGAVLRATGALATGTDDARARLLALWSADNALAAIRISSAWPPVGRTTFACPQGAYRFVCRQVVTAFQSPLVRQVTVSVFASAASRNVLAEAATVVQDEARH
ncbi:type II secretion system minor pseudopilin GspI [Paraburkholderia sp. D15]|uniref:type II secretion system minor pseudopilin GspI n=1 Tax=Paraburkholderia sp. D15 TaxID=2880218 RepID=UPI002479219B|nr:type II secretion system minor pseudopilin GspI [Paraburkholderia sp. D15]WGS48388.1 type II secretion system minor pseudopilin GspI [Paraburkholderia sp. D15]WKF56268.1 Type II secretion system protein I [Paraburkholderia busanensis]